MFRRLFCGWMVCWQFYEVWRFHFKHSFQLHLQSNTKYICPGALKGLQTSWHWFEQWHLRCRGISEKWNRHKHFRQRLQNNIAFGSFLQYPSYTKASVKPSCWHQHTRCSSVMDNPKICWQNKVMDGYGYFVTEWCKSWRHCTY